MIENAVILAAGTGSRLKPLTDHAPKCLTEINGTPILLNALDNLVEIGIIRCVIVTGYFSEAIKDVIGTDYRGTKIEYIYNKHFYKTNDMYSLWLAKEIMKTGTILLEGDIFFRSETLGNALTGMGGRSYYLAGKYNGTDNEILITTGPDYEIKSIDVLKNRKGVIDNLNFMSSGMMVIQADYGKHFSQWLTVFVNEKNVNILFDEILSEYTSESALHVFEISHKEWVEIDTIEDLKRAEKVFQPLKNLKQI
ncbi:MAG: phosphocholine cytidylyltransferase family protein [Spirochaetes bacterium]|nr:phosphocholine cytidylyltransferase family protein [Spirochaetota bacterium]